MIRLSIIFLLATFILGCTRDPGKPQAVLTYQSIERLNPNLYLVTYTSNMDLLNIFDKAKGDSQLTSMLVCSLDGDTLFSAEHVIKKSFDGVIGVNGKTPGPPFVFKTLGNLVTTDDNWQNRRNLQADELSSLLRAHQHVVCKAAITTFGYKAYYSKPMLIPSQDILREVEKTPRTWIKGAGDQYLPPEFRVPLP